MFCDNYFVYFKKIVSALGSDKSCHRLRAFTLIEVLIVMVILGIAAVAAVPMFSSAGDLQVRSAANIIASDLEYAKNMAITRGKNYSVIFDAANETYRIVDPNGEIDHPVKKGFKYIMNFKTESRLNRVDIVSAQFQPGANSTITFDYLGSPYSGNSAVPTNSLDSGTINISTGDAAAVIHVEPITGYISITN